MTGGRRPADPSLADGFFFEPTILADVTSEMKIAREEVFGPVLAILKWSDEESMFEQVNGLELGLTGSVWTENINTAHNAARRIQAGYIWINGVSRHYLGAPYGGVKQSGIGREDCLEELFEFTQHKNVNVTLLE